MRAGLPFFMHGRESTANHKRAMPDCHWVGERTALQACLLVHNNHKHRKSLRFAS